jgi:O-antigen ligase
MYAEISDSGDLVLYDENQAMIPYYTATTDDNGYILQIDDMRFYEIVPIINNDSIDGITFYINGYYFTFTKQTNPETYLYYNRYGKYSPIKSIDSGIFAGHESFASFRGYIWGRTIPLFQDYIFLGSGADSFIHSFPQHDYVNYINYGYEGQLITKPHNYYLQVGIQTGLLSLISLLLFFGIYLVQSFRLFLKNQFTTVSSRIGLSVFIAVISFLVSSITNDSSISVSPIFWIIIGIGFVSNVMERTKSQHN